MAAEIILDRGDITKLKVDCIVNAAKKSLMGGGGVDGAIHQAAGPGLLEECRKLHGCKTGEAKITGGYRLPAPYVIHTVGPVYTGAPREADELAQCYRNTLDLAKAHEIHSIAFPAISTGVYGYPVDQAVPIAYHAVTDWLRANEGYEIKVIFSCFDQSVYDLYCEMLA